MAVQTLEDALQCALNTAREQPAEVPEKSAQWMEEADAALSTGRRQEFGKALDKIVRAHSAYRANWEIRPWLYEAREALIGARQECSACGSKHAPGLNILCHE